MKREKGSRMEKTKYLPRLEKYNMIWRPNCSRARPNAKHGVKTITL